MRRLLVGFVVAAAAALVPTWTMAGNQEVAEQIASGLKESGRLHGYKIGVKYQDGTAWLKGQVTSKEQMDTALQLAIKSPGVTRVVNNLTIAPQQTASNGREATKGSETIQASVTEQVAKITPAVEETPALQQVGGALAAEQRTRSVARDMRGSQLDRPAVEAQPVQPSIQERLVSNFSTSEAPEINTIALQEPTPAPPQAPEAVEQPAPRVARMQAPTPAETTVPQPAAPQTVAPRSLRPMPMAQARPYAGAPLPMGAQPGVVQQTGGPLPMGASAVRYDHPNMPNYAWPSYAAYPNYAAVTYPKQHSPCAWPYIGPFYPYPQVPLEWRKVTLEWHDGWWNLDFDDGSAKGSFSGLFRPFKR